VRRFERRIFVDKPDTSARATLVARELQGVAHTLSDDDVAAVAAATDGFSAADVAAAMRDARGAPLRDIDLMAATAAWRLATRRQHSNERATSSSLLAATTTAPTTTRVQLRAVSRSDVDTSISACMSTEQSVSVFNDYRSSMT
jgi:SpoVK/Ycf46/Vps4 family AAA+-type ATPase